MADASSSSSGAMAVGGGSDSGAGEVLVLVARKPRFGLPTACPSCLPVYLYLRMANVPFRLDFHDTFPDSDHIPYVEYGDCVAFNNEKGGVVESLKQEHIVDLNSKHPSLSVPDLVTTRAMITSWLADAVHYELWVALDGRIAHDMYYSELPWPIGKLLYWKQARDIKLFFGITKFNSEEKEEEIYRKANVAYDALSTRLGDQLFLFDNRPTDVDAFFLGHVLFVLALPDTSVLRNHLLKYENLVKYADHLKVELLETSSSLSSTVGSHVDASASPTSKQRASSAWRFKPKPKPKKERTEEEKTFRRRAKYFLGAQLIAVLVFLSVMGGVDGAELEDGEDFIDGED